MLPALAIGEVYAARVTALMSDGRALLELGGLLVPARANAALRAGEDVWVEVLRLVPEVVLKLRRTDT
ncbi:MAG: hypothetical protein KBD01_02955 [Acidobacteria bacterium]|nr:hypothetical protein [Acidobacteriota bacterium]